MCLTDACVWICTSMHGHIEARGQPQMPFLKLSTLSVLRQRFPVGSGSHQQTRLTGQRAPQIRSSSPLQHWDYKHAAPCLVLTWVLRIELRSLCCAAITSLRDRHSTGVPLSSKDVSTIAFKIFFQVLLWCCNFHASRDSNQVTTVCLWAAFVHRDYAVSSADWCILNPETLGMGKVHLSMVKFG